MQRHSISSIVVAEDRHPLGIFTERDAVMQSSRRNDLRDMTVGEVMSSPLVVARPDLELHDAYQLMVDQGIRHLLVVDDDDLLIGIASEGDFAIHLDPWLLNQLDRVESVMTRNIISGEPQETVAAGIRRMADRHISCIVVGRPDRAEGVLTERDVTQLLLSDINLDQEILDNVIHRPVHSIRQSESLHLARERMDSLGVRRLLVTDAADNWVGLITRHDLLCGLEQNYWRNLHANEALFRNLYEQAPLPYQSLDEQGCLLAVNRAWEETLGYSREEVLGRFIGDFHLPGQEEKLQQGLTDFIENGCVDGVFFKFRCSDGSQKTMSVNGRITCDEAGHFQRTHCILTDITEQVRKEQLLRESEQRFREVAENIEDVFWVTDPQSREIIYINPAYERLWGRSCESLYKDPRSFINGVHPRDHERFIREIENLACGIYHDMEYSIVRPDGSECRVRDRAFPVHDANGKVYRVAGIIQDITNIHQANTALRESEARFRSIFENAAAGMAIGTPDGQLYEVNSALADMLGYSRLELIHKSIKEITHPGDWEASHEKTKEVRSGEKSTIQLQKRYLKKDGSALWGHLSEAWVRDEEGKPLYFVALIQDIDQKKKAEALLHEQLAERASLLNAAPVGIGLVRNREFQWLSQRFLNMLGYSEEELLGKNSRCVYPNDEEYERVGTEKYAQIKATGFGELETLMRHRDGHSLNVLLSSVPLDQNNIFKGTIFTALDITERKKTQQALRGSELRYQSLVENIPAVVYSALLDEIGTVFYLAPQSAEIIGYTQQDVERNPNLWRESLHPDDRECVLQLLDESRKNKIPFSAEYRLLTKDGRVIHVRDDSSLVPDDHGGYLHGILQDITSQKIAEVALQQKNTELKALLDTIPSSVFFKDRELRYQMVNHAFLEFMELSSEQVIGKTDAEFFPSAKAEEFMSDDKTVIIQKQKVTQLEQEVPDPSGSSHWFNTIKTPLSNSKGEVVGLVGISTEITQLKDLAEQRLAKEQALRETLIREVHHRIKNHLQGVVGMLHNLTHSCTDINQCLEKAITQVRTIATVYGLYGHTGKNRLSIKKLVEACISIYTQDESLQIKCEFGDLSALFLAREESVPVALVINELIANAIKHSNASKGKHIVSVMVKRLDRKIRLRVSNYSDGLPGGFDFKNGKALGTGLELIRTLMSPQGSQLDIYQQNDLVVAELIIRPPVLWVAD